jgi:peptide subunit release factor 1 (eRF1)
MPKTTTALETPLRAELDHLAAFAPVAAPVLSLYLDLRPDQHGREHVDAFLRKTFLERSRTLKGDARRSFERDSQRIREYLEGVPRSANGAALFACAAANDFFEAVHLTAPLEQHALYIGSVPHLYPLARLNDQYPRYAAVLVDTNSARIMVFSLGHLAARGGVSNVKTKHTSVGGTAQARYQRHTENVHLHHIKEVVAILDRVVRGEHLETVVLACEEVVRPVLLEQLPKHLARKVLDMRALDMKMPDHQALADTLGALREHDRKTDAEHVEAMLGAWRAGGLAVVGPVETLEALAMQQVEELLIAASPQYLDKTWNLPPGSAPGPVDIDSSAPEGWVDPERVQLAGELVRRAQQNAARIRFIEDPSLLAYVGGVGALLRFKIPMTGAPAASPRESGPGE